MNSTKIFIAAILIMMASNLLSGCGQASVSSLEDPIARIQSYQAIKKNVSLRLEQQIKGNDLMVTVFLENPERKPLTSVQSWLSFNAHALEGMAINVGKSSFDLGAPYPNEFDPSQGLVRLGAASTKPLDDAVLQVAQLTFKRKVAGITMLDAYDYRDDLSGHLSANMMIETVPYNILLKPESPLLIIQ